MLSTVAIRTVIEAAGNGNLPNAVSTCLIPAPQGPLPLGYPTKSSGGAVQKKSAPGTLQQACFVSALTAAIQRASVAKPFQLDAHVQKLWLNLVEIQRHKSALDKIQESDDQQMQSSLFSAISNLAKAQVDVAKNTITNIKG